VAEQVVLVIGDACGEPDNNPGARAVGELAQQLVGQHPDAIVLLLGDNAYNDGTAAEYAEFFAPVMGTDSLKSRIRACAGNHDYHTAGAMPYFSALGVTAAGTPDQSYYSFDAGDWHFISLNSEVEQDQDSRQLQWLRDDLSSRQRTPIVAFWHRPRWGSGGHRDSNKPRWFWKELVAHRAEIALNGHAHHYERFAPQTPDQVANPAGMREFIVGTGGRKLAGRTKFTPNSELARFDSFGLLKLTLGTNTYRWEFVSTAGTILDQGQTPTNR
jgi:calcineurin-like phosphoesterase family protein